MKTITVETDQSKNYLFAGEALEDEGYKEVGEILYTKQFKKVSASLYAKDEELYVYKGMNHFNTIIYDIKLGLVRTLSGEYEIIENNQLLSLQGEI